MILIQFSKIIFCHCFYMSQKSIIHPFYLVKIIDIVYVSIIYFIMAYFCAGLMDSYFVRLFGNENKEKHKYRLIGECLIQVIIIAVISYLVRNLVSMVPFPLDGMYGFKHKWLKELSESGGFFSVFFIIFQYNLQEKLIFLSKRDFS